MKGIISFLDYKVDISAGGNLNAKYFIQNIRSHDYSYFYNYGGNYEPKKIKDNYIKFDFQSKQIVLKFYFIRSNGNDSTFNHPKTWKIEGSNDDVNWSLIDRRECDSNLRGRYEQNLFECQESNDKISYRFIRYVQEDSWLEDKPYYINITYFELYGDIIG